MASTLERLRASSWVDRIGLSLVGLVILWLVVNFFKGPARVHQRRPDRADERRDLRRRRARLHARLRDPAADQLRPRRRVRALRALRQHADRLRARSRHRLERPRDHRRDALRAARRDDRVRGLQRHDRARRLQAAPARAAPRAADHRGRHVVHRPEHRARVLRRRLPLGARLHPADGRDRDRRRVVPVEQARRDPHHRAAPSASSRGSFGRRSRGRPCGRSRRTARPPR